MDAERRYTNGRAIDLVGREKAHDLQCESVGRFPGAEDGGGGGDEKRVEGTRRLTQPCPVPLPVMPVTCTSRVCLPASRSGSYLHSADEAATVLRVLLPEDLRQPCTWVYTECRASRGLSLSLSLSPETECDGEFLRATMITMRNCIPDTSLN